MRSIFLIYFHFLLKTKLNKPPGELFSKAASRMSWMPLANKASFSAFYGNSITGLSLFVGTTL
jgi:hypothetical protein